MLKLEDRILSLLQGSNGLTDRQLTDTLLGPGEGPQKVNAACHRLEGKGLVSRRPRPDRIIGNYLATGPVARTHQERTRPSPPGFMSEDTVKRSLKKWLESDTWQVRVMWGGATGIDVQASKDGKTWIIETKGSGSSPQMRSNYFLAVLGAILQKMNDPNAAYSIGLPDCPRFRNLWDALPRLAKLRTGITVLFVDEHGEVRELSS